MIVFRITALAVMIVWTTLLFSGDDITRWPEAVDEAVEILKEQRLSAKDRAMLLKLSIGTVMATLHHGFGTSIRNKFGLWTGNDKLVQSCGQSHPKL
jgi:hypothetical protein